MRFFQKPYRWAICYSMVLLLFTAFMLLDTFVIPRAGVPVQPVAAATPSATVTPSATATPYVLPSDMSTPTPSPTPIPTVITETSYSDANINITIETVYEYDTYVYIADVKITSLSYLKTAFAENTYGRNIKALTSEMASDAGAIFAINGDYYGFRDNGFVLRNGVLYRDTHNKLNGGEGLVVDSDGDFSIIDENETDAQGLADSGVWQILSFGPGLISGGELTVNKNSKVRNEMASNPRTAVGQISPFQYLFVVSDGRTQESAGLSLLELAQIMYDRGCSVAYNLDGGGSATMWFNGVIINKPTDSKGEREVSDIVYIGY